MNGTTEDLLRQALRRQAERAVDPGRVRAALPARATRRARRRYGSLAGGLVALRLLFAVGFSDLAFVIDWTRLVLILTGLNVLLIVVCVAAAWPHVPRDPSGALQETA